MNMGKWDEEREWLKASRDVAEISQERITQEYDIVMTQQESLWSELTDEFRSAVDSINLGSGTPLLRIDALRQVRGFAVIAGRPKNMATASVVFAPELHQVTIKFTGRDDIPSLKYIFRANERNRAELSERNAEITNEDIVRETLARLR